MGRKYVFIFFLFLTMGMYLYSAPVEQSVRKKCSGIVLKDVSGKSVKMSEYFGKELMIVFWSVNCSHCISMIDVFKDIYKDYKDKLNLISFLMVPVNERVKKFLKVYDIPYPVYQRNKKLEGCLWGVERFPTIYFIDKDGIIKKMTEGEKEEDYIKYLIEKKLNIK